MSKKAVENIDLEECGGCWARVVLG